MRFALAFAGLAIAGCSSGESSALPNDAAIDGDPDANAYVPPRNDPGPGPFTQPFDTTFVTPAGELHTSFLDASVLGAFCNPPVWGLRFYATESPDLGQPSVVLTIRLPPYENHEVTGTLPAQADYGQSLPALYFTTTDARFEATRIDYPGDGAPRITGRFVVTDPAWTIDLEIDVLGIASGCL